jgi:hypothetical protein
MFTVNYIQWRHKMTLREVDWNAISPVFYIILGLAVVGIIASCPDAKDPGMLLLGAVLTRIKIPSTK